MAGSARRKKNYQTSGNVAYQERYSYDGSAVRVPRPRHQTVQPEPQKRPRIHPRRQVRQRPRIEVRQAGAVAPFSVFGFLVVALCATILVISYAQLAVLSDQAVTLKNNLKTLKTTETTLLAQYELAYDLAAIEEQLTSNGSMVKLQPSQVTYLDISEPDSIIIYGESRRGFNDIIDTVENFFTQILKPAS